jgi:hypothetical protein
MFNQSKPQSIFSYGLSLTLCISGVILFAAFAMGLESSHSRATEYLKILLKYDGFIISTLGILCGLLLAVFLLRAKR